MASVPRSRAARAPRLLSPLAAACALACGLTDARAQAEAPGLVASAALQPAASGASAPAAPAASPAAVQRVTVQAGHAGEIAATGFDAPIARTPIQADAIDATTMADLGAHDLGVVTRLDASVSDAYNSAGYWTFFTVRGFVIDNRLNYRRDGLPINAETALPLADKERIEVLKGTSSLQAGTSAPGGLVNLVVKRPDSDLRRVTVFAEQGGTLGTALDWSQRLGDRRQFGLRLNVETARLDPQIHDLPGHRHSVALAADWRPAAGSTVEVEWEHSDQSQRSQPGFSLLGGTLPSPRAIDPRTNLNDQPWSLPVVLQGNTGSIRWRQQLDDAWTLQVHAGTQHLVSNDRVAFPYGFYDPDTYQCAPCDGFTSDGRFTIWDFRSEDERRQTDALDLSLQGHVDTFGVKHELTFGALGWRFLGRFNDESYAIAGVGSVDGRTIVPPNPDFSTPNTDRTDRTTELYLRDHAEFGDDWGAWAGIRRTHLHRQSWQTASGVPDAATDYTQSLDTPWLALSKGLTEADLVYASWGEGLQSDVVPTIGSYPASERGKAAPTQVSRQWEAGYKHGTSGTRWGIDWYDMDQAQFTDIDTSTTGVPALMRVADGRVRARGVEAEADTRLGAFTLRASAMWQRARVEGASISVPSGTRPANVPEHALKAFVGYDVAALPGLRLTAAMDHQGSRAVLPDDSVNIPAWTTFDIGTRYVQALGGSTLVWRAGVDNVGDRRAWRESPYQYDHAYLFPLAPRTWKISLEATL